MKIFIPPVSLVLAVIGLLMARGGDAACTTAGECEAKKDEENK